jgi:2-keto-4-pentenoate hydratase
MPRDPFSDPRVAAGMAAQLRARRTRLGDGARSLGWKLGMGGDAARQQLGTGGPLVGFLIEDDLLPDGAQVPIGGWEDPRFEPELAVRIGTGGGIDAVAAAIELADTGHMSDDVESLLRLNVFQRHVILGEIRDPDVLPTSSTVLRNGEQIDTTTDPLAPGDPVALVAYVGAVLDAVGEPPPRPGEWLITGAIFPPLAVVPGQRFEHQLEPLGSVSVSFES